MCLVAIYMFSLANVYLGLLPTFLLGCLFSRYWVVWTVYILEIKPLSVVSFANIFSYSTSCLFFLSFLFFFFLCFPLLCIRFICSFLLLFLLPQDTDLRKYCYDLCQRKFCLCSLLGVKWGHTLYLGLSTILSLFLI